MLNPQQKGSNYCPHITAARDAEEHKRYASIDFVNVEDLAKRISDEDIEKLLQDQSIEGEIAVYNLPGGNQVVPNIYEDDAFVHVRYCTKIQIFRKWYNRNFLVEY